MLAESTAFPATAYAPLCAPPARTEDILLELPQPLIVLLADRRVVFANARAEALLASGCGCDSAGFLAKLPGNWARP